MKLHVRRALMIMVGATMMLGIVPGAAFAGTIQTSGYFYGECGSIALNRQSFVRTDARGSYSISATVDEATAVANSFDCASSPAAIDAVAVSHDLTFTGPAVTGIGGSIPPGASISVGIGSATITHGAPGDGTSATHRYAGIVSNGLPIQFTSRSTGSFTAGGGAQVETIVAEATQTLL